MTREEAIEVIQNFMGWFKPDSRIYKALKMAISAMLENEELSKDLDEALKEIDGYEQGLEQEPTEKAMTVDEMEREYEKSKALFHKIVECDDTYNIRKDILKCRVGNIVAYNVEWLKKHWQMEMEIVCGVKPCTDAVSQKENSL